MRFEVEVVKDIYRLNYRVRVTCRYNGEIYGFDHETISCDQGHLEYRIDQGKREILKLISKDARVDIRFRER